MHAYRWWRVMLAAGLVASLAACSENTSPAVPTATSSPGRMPLAVPGIATPPELVASPIDARPTMSVAPTSFPAVPPLSIPPNSATPATVANASATAIVTTAVPTVAPMPVLTSTPTPVIATELRSTISPATPIATPRPTVVLLHPLTPTVMPTTMPATLMAALDNARRANQLDQSSVTVLLPGMDAISLDGMRKLYAASTIKLPIYLTLAYRIQSGTVRFTWDTPVTIRREDIVGGTGLLQGMPGQTLPLRDIARLMITESDNTAANIILGYLGGGQNAQWSDVRAGAQAVTQDMIERLKLHGILMQHGLEDEAGMALGLTNTVTTDALVTLLQLTVDGRGALAGADSLYALLEERGMHNPWHPGETAPCNLHVLRIGGIYPADRTRSGVRLDVLLIDGPSQPAYFLAVGVVTTPALEPEIEARIAHFEGDVQQLLSDAHTWEQCVDSRTHR